VNCAAGSTQIRRVLAHVLQEAERGRVSALVYVGDCMEEPSGALAAPARTRERHVNIGGSVREFLRRLNIDPGGESMAQFRKQMLALSCCRMTLGMMTANGPAQINAEPIEGFRAWHTDEDGQQTLWPGVFMGLTFAEARRLSPAIAEFSELG
jgi:hypothetical protein